MVCAFTIHVAEAKSYPQASHCDEAAPRPGGAHPGRRAVRNRKHGTHGWSRDAADAGRKDGKRLMPKTYVLEYTNATAGPDKGWRPRVRKLARDGKITTLATIPEKEPEPGSK